jgi:hypothetical protein
MDMLLNRAAHTFKVNFQAVSGLCTKISVAPLGLIPSGRDCDHGLRPWLKL